MHRLLLALLATIGLVASIPAASAADLPVKAAPRYVAALFSWTGLYIGGNIGGLRATKDSSVTGTGAAIGSNSPSGFLGGAQIGNLEGRSWKHPTSAGER